MSRPTWDEYFIGLAFMISQRSLDTQTKHGAVIVDSQNHIVGTGYNSFPPGLPDETLPNTRPLKYPWMRHAEDNALINLMVVSHHIDGLRCYVTGKPCFDCIQRLGSSNIKDVYFPDAVGWQKDVEEAERWDKYVRDANLSINIIRGLDLSWMDRAYKYSLERVKKDEKPTIDDDGIHWIGDSM